MNLAIIFSLIIMLLGIYLVTLGIWELRLGHDRSKYMLYTFSGLFLIFILPSLLTGGAFFFV